MVISAAFLIAIFAGVSSMSSGTIDMQDFYGTSAESPVFVDSGNISAFASSTSRDNARATITYRSNGTVDSEALPPGLPPGNFDNWLISGSADSFEIRAIVINGETPVGESVGVWHPLSSDVSWSVSTGSGEGFATAFTTINVQIRIAGGLIQSSGTISLSARKF